MHMMIRRYEVPASQADEVIRRVDDSWVGKVSSMRGFVSYHVVRSAEDRLVSMTAFVDEETALAAGEASAEWVGGWLMDLDVKFLELESGPVVSHAGT
jgi:heme-degrading monooxygenase HmoA